MKRITAILMLIVTATYFSFSQSLFNVRTEGNNETKVTSSKSSTLLEKQSHSVKSKKSLAKQPIGNGSLKNIATSIIDEDMPSSMGHATTKTKAALSESFDGTTFPPVGWTTYDVLGTSNWARVTTSTHSGAGCARILDSDPRGEDWLVTPKLTVSAGNTFSFWIRANYSAYYGNDSVFVLISTTDNQMSSFTTTLAEYEIQTDYTFTYQQKTIDLSAYAGLNVYIAIKEINDFANGVRIDDVAGPEVFQITDDAGVTQISSPISNCFLGSTETVTVKVQNFGTNSLSNIPVSYTVNGGAPVTETVAGPIAGAAFANYTFTQKANLSVPGNYTIKAYTTLAGETNHNNDTTTAIVVNAATSTPPYTMGFEPAESLAGWKVENTNADANTWGIITTLGNTAPYCAAYQYNTTNAANDWIITKCIDFETGKNYKLEFVYKAYDAAYPEGLDVFIGTSPVSTSLTTLIVDLGTNITNIAYLTSSTNFTVPSTGTYYIGFHAKSLADMYVLFIDDINITEVFSNDAGVIGFFAPVNQSSCSYTNAEQIGVAIRNFGGTTLTNFPVKYSINGGAPVTENVAGPLASNDTLFYTFTTTADFSVDGTYNITSYTQVAGDGNLNNDTSYYSIYNVAPSNVPYAMGFETGESLLAWSVLDENTDGSTWGIYNAPTYAHTGNNVAGYEYNATNIANDWLVTTCINLTGGTIYKLKFFYKVASATWPEKLAVYYGTSPSAGSLTNLIVDLGTLSNTTYDSSITNFTPSATGVYYIGFKAYSDADMFNLYIDDINLSEYSIIDLAMDSILSPTTGPNLTASEQVTIRVKNNSTTAKSNIPVSYSIDGGTPLTGTITGPVAPGATADFTFTQTADLSAVQSYTILARVSFTNDEVAPNDTLLKVVVNTGNFIIMDNNPVTTCIGDFYDSGIDTGNYSNDEDFTKVFSPETAGNAIRLAFTKFYTEDTYDFMYIYDGADINAPLIGTYTGTNSPGVVTATNLNGQLTVRFTSDFSVNDTGWVATVSCTPLPAKDIGVIGFVNPGFSIGCGLTSTESIVVKIKNFGLQSCNNFTVSYILNGGTPVAETVTSTIPSGGTLDYTFGATANLSPTNTYILTAYTSLAGDAVTSNNTFTDTIYSTNPYNTPYTMGFEASETFDWTVVNANNDAKTWTINTTSTYAHTGTQSAMYSYNTAEAADDWLITPCINLNTASIYKLEYFFRVRSATYPENLEVYYGASPDPASMTNLLFDHNSITNTTFQPSDTIFTVPGTGVYYFGFHTYSDADMWNIYLDDVSITEVFPNDLGVLNVTLPQPECGLGGIAVTAAIVNYGQNPASNFDITYTVNGVSPVTENYTGTLQPGDTLNFTFIQQATVTSPGDYIISVSVNLTGDNNTVNNSASDTTTNLAPVTAPYVTTFNTAADRLGWKIIDANVDSYTWGINNTAGIAGSPVYAYSYNIANAANDYLFSRCIDLTAGTQYKLDFKYAVASSFYPENVNVFIATDNIPSAVIDTIVDLNSIINTVYDSAITQFTVLTSGTYYIGFHCYSDADMYRAYVDDVKVYEVPTALLGENQTICGGSPATLTIELTGTQPWTVIYSDGTTTDTFTNIIASPYTFNVTPTINTTYTLVSVEDYYGTGAVSGSAVVTVIAIPTADVSGTATICAGNSTDLIINLTGVQPWNVIYTDGTVSDTIANITASPYTLTVTPTVSSTYTLLDVFQDACHGTVSGNADITVNEIPTVTLTGTTTICHDSSAVLTVQFTGAQPWDFTLSDGSATTNYTGITANPYEITVNPLVATDYTITVVSDANCTGNGSDTVTITVNEVITTISGTDITCNGNNDGTIDLLINGGTTPYTIVWSNGATVQNLTGLAPDTYDVTVSDSYGCSATNTYTIAEPAAIDITYTVTTPGCGASDGAIDITVTGGTTPYDFEWSTSVITEDLINVPAGIYSVSITDANNCTYNNTIILNNQNAPVISNVTVTQILCNGDTTGAINITVSGGTPSYTFNWSNSDNTEDVINLAAGIYSLTITDAANCEAFLDTAVTQPDAIVLTLSGTSPVCNGGADGSATVAITGGISPFDVLWSTSETTETITGLNAGMYTINITDNNGCIAQDSIEITDPAAITLFITETNVLCNGDSTGSADMTISNGTSPYSILWSNGATTEDITGLNADTYTVVVTDVNGCNATDSVAITEPDAIVLTLVPTDATCNGGNTGSIDLTVTGGSGTYTYTWSNSETTEDISGLTDDTYTVVVNDGNCTATDSATVNEPTAITATIATVDALCNGDTTGSADITTITGGTGSYTVLWSNGETTETIANLGAGTYYVDITDANGCVVSDSAIISEPDAIILTLVPADATCNGGNTGSIDLSVTGGSGIYTYNWSNSETTEDISGLNADTYTVVVNDGNCTATDSATVNEPSALTVSSVVTNVSCYGSSDGTVTFTASGGTAPYTYIPGGTLINLSIGTYTVTVTDNGGCQATGNATVTQPQALVLTLSSTPDDGSCNGTASVTASGGDGSYQYMWNDLIGSTTDSISPLCYGVYTVTVTDGNGCIAVDSVDVILTSIPAIADSKAISVYPNPTRGKINIINAENSKVYIYNLTGEVIMVFENAEVVKSVDISGLAAGSYIIKVYTDNKVYTGRIMLHR
ncbi:MAG: choice-of-anchor J domain-containing protein [Bacteroidia bacterium]|nr:choice-of-anchor J domain-containing protein [Bacteroidia bacterium]